MVRHISVFFLKEDQKEENKKVLLERLQGMESSLTNIASYHAGADCMERPPKGVPGVPDFGDVVQVIDFLNEKEAADYVKHPAHLALVESMSVYLEKVVAIDVNI